ncbi:Spx/MgsR family RNA polymerase-binding regulatory protein [Lactococcus formosensis]|jgi:transcriptional regulator, Spx/MgsR family|uniref:Spx/MgsR family RNA polymerase-binding regulatory protein n=1 Tax=Lactococcus formosensis TaxID=1281486 RepID=UPI0003086063|nr:Spx/MgsR family RNA polymerase-binding regulatory protein [Lactococcus formosensis]MCH1723151.1 Spx/MgsR family RNA polymerase-binding regulatory protein [Lactococcus formosensis]MCO7179601.1 Spx/MgsR family RNA polymerase-binding regulatory protein [Lactococcus formosensis]MDG6112876.1 Spx/MgsR family RNA polymerase-binding regulatory protein [Lactococcus formosensis]MDG6115114.1 Spx/MgsR family RNA polymerase-binding regulatory protein [Lactococcus formosensis]MDG6119267.1 Spx/MgsR family
MLKIYTISSNQETKEAEHWLYAHKVKFVEVDVLKERVSTEEILRIVSLTEHGVEEIIATETRAYTRLNLNFNDLKLEDFMELLEENATLLKVPLMLDEKQLQIGFDEDKMQRFLEKPSKKITDLEKQEMQTG